VACGGGADTEPLVFLPTPTRVVQGGALTASYFEREGHPLTRGLGAVRVVASADGGTLLNEALTLTPWMPAMGHGSSVIPSVEVDPDGGFIVTRLSLPMPGTWELRCDFSGEESDHVVASFEIP
jgi:hypothetical protein